MKLERKTATVTFDNDLSPRKGIAQNSAQTLTIANLQNGLPSGRQISTIVVQYRCPGANLVLSAWRIPVRSELIVKTSIKYILWSL